MIKLTGKQYVGLMYNPYKQPVVTLKLWIRQQTVIAEGICFKNRRYLEWHKRYPYGITYAMWRRYNLKLSKQK